MHQCILCLYSIRIIYVHLYIFKIACLDIMTDLNIFFFFILRHYLFDFSLWLNYYQGSNHVAVLRPLSTNTSIIQIKFKSLTAMYYSYKMQSSQEHGFHNFIRSATPKSLILDSIQTPRALRFVGILLCPKYVPTYSVNIFMSCS